MEQARAQLLSGWQWFVERAHTAHAKVWLVVLFFLESILFPIPPDPLLIALSTAKREWWAYFALLASAASIAGAVVGYILAALFYDTIGAQIVAWYGFAPEVALVAERFADNTFWVMLAAAFTPLPFKVFVLTAGFLKVPFLIFLIAGALGRTTRYLVTAYFSSVYGERAVALGIRYANLITIAVVVLALLYILYRVVV